MEGRVYERERAWVMGHEGSEFQVTVCLGTVREDRKDWEGMRSER